ncbi:MULTISPECIES: hypothetical protein [Brevibacterium]|uniref:Uncharacterized protein n=1 Tax=Brevibacterium antiquum CNRZ 918 TaxID=1255637 RepID=A0A2H1KZ84_9MICO|nr:MULTISPECIES: hypothetical protein [Brevibacterium]SMY05076.1 hypothetical protein BANT918_03260 [Brevibacterium antiquum CNRZ 918]
MTKTTDSQTALLEHLRSRIREGWDHDPLFIDPSVEPGLTPRQKSSLTHASAQASTSDIPHFIAIVPGLSNSEATQDGWGRFTADFAYSMFESAKAEQIIVIFSEAEYSASTFAYIVDDSGPRVPRGSDQLQRSKTNRFLPVELAVPYHLNLLIATVKGTEPPPLPDFDPRADEDDYIQANGLDYGDPDGFVFKATAAAAIGLTAWVLLRRNRYAWRNNLTRGPELVRNRRLPQALEAALRELPDPAAPDEEMWALHDRGRRVQTAITEIVATHPDWATDIDFSHRHAILALTETDRWLRKHLQRTPSAKGTKTRDEEPRFCFFFPTHTGAISGFAWRQGTAVLTINVCVDCRADLNAGHEPECLMVPKAPGAKRVKAVPYYQRDDAYAVSGFGSFADLEDAIVTKMGSGRE